MNSETIARLARELLADHPRLEDFVRQLSAIHPDSFPPDSRPPTLTSAELDEVTLDLDRARRCGFPEVIYSEGKRVEALLQTIHRLRDAGQDVLCTRLDAEKAAAIASQFPEGIYHPRARTFRMAVTPPHSASSTSSLAPSGPSSSPSPIDSTSPNDAPREEDRAGVTIITAGTSDLPIAEEARETLLWMGIDPTWIQDVGVAGPHRLREHLGEFEDAAAIIVVAGMEGALPSVVGGYARCPVIAVPTSVGYGAALGGIAPLLGMLNSCAANVTVVNIDAGFKAAYLAGLIARQSRPSAPTTTPATPVSTSLSTSTSTSTSRPASLPSTVRAVAPRALPRLPARAADGHKGNYGHVVIIGGSRGMSGAVGMAGMAALRSGAGLVTLAVPSTIAATVAQFEPSYMTWPLAADDDGMFRDDAHESLSPLLEKAQCVAIGPGLGRSPASDRLVYKLFDSLRVPLVVDADGLNALSERPWTSPPGPRLLTPHPGEYRRFCPDAPRDRKELELHATDWAESRQVTLILKGHRSLITESGQVFWNDTGNPGMATGGTGDVLTGMVTAILGQGLSPVDSARLACYVHGRAGDLAAEVLGEVSLMASDLVRWLPAAWCETQNGPHPQGELVGRC